MAELTARDMLVLSANAHLQKHRRTHYQETQPNSQAFNCTVKWCKKFGKSGYSFKDKLDRHWKEKHPNEPRGY